MSCDRYLRNFERGKELRLTTAILSELNHVQPVLCRAIGDDLARERRAQVVIEVLGHLRWCIEYGELSAGLG